MAARDEFINAIAYLIRRLDENTAPENFLRYSPDLEVDSKEWNFLKEEFLNSCDYQEKAQNTPNRIQDRNTESFPETVSSYHQNLFANEPDTDWSMAANRKWAENIRAGKLQKRNWERCLSCPRQNNFKNRQGKKRETSRLLISRSEWSCGITIRRTEEEALSMWAAVQVSLYV